MNKAELRIDWATHEAAKYACEHWHYSKRIPSASLKIGVWERNKFIGVVIFGRGAASEIGSPYNLPQTEICELVRIALNKHESPVTRIVSIALKFLVRKCPGVRMVVSFSDTAQNHHGGIYQGGGWVYVGGSAYHAYLVKGKMIHPKTLHSLYGVGGQSVSWLRKHIDPKAERITTGIKHKYLMPLDAEMRKRIFPLSKPYPKRAQGDTKDTPGNLPGEGGSTPTCALQSSGSDA